MLYIAENLRALRRGRDWTQEEVAEMLSVSAQSVSKWERGETYPDITMLPALACLYKTSIDALFGMDRITDTRQKHSIFMAGRQQLLAGDIEAAVMVYREALKIFPNDSGLMSELALALSLGGEASNIQQAIDLCEEVLSCSPPEKVRHTTRAALCFMYMKAGDRDKAIASAQHLPHMRESREAVLEQLEQELCDRDIDLCLQYIATGVSV